MSAVAARPLRQPAEPRRAPLRAVRPRPRTRPKLLQAGVVLLGVALIFGAQLLLSIVVSSGQYEIAALQSQQKDLDRTAESLQENLQKLSSTQHLAENAAVLGMVQGTGASYLRLSDGAVIPAANPTPRNGCWASCGLVANDLLTGLPLVQPSAGPQTGAAQQPATQNATQQSVAQGGAAQGDTTTPPPASQQGPQTGTIPAPVTR